MIFRNTLRFCLALGTLSAAAHAATIFNFDGDNLGTTTSFTDTVNGLSATFSSPGDPGGFVVYQSFFQTLTGNVLGDPGPAAQDNLALSVAFSQNLSAITLNFATADFTTPQPLTLTAYENATQVGSNSLPGFFLNGSTFPEGELAFSGIFNRVVLTSTSPDFAVDNLNVIPAAAAPEPAGFLLLGSALFALGFPALRRKSGNK